MLGTSHAEDPLQASHMQTVPFEPQNSMVFAGGGGEGIWESKLLLENRREEKWRSPGGEELRIGLSSKYHCFNRENIKGSTLHQQCCKQKMTSEIL